MDLDEALTVVVSRDGDRLLSVGFQLTHERAAAQDLVQGALLRVYSTVRRGGREPEDWYAYLRRAVINEFLRTRRLRSGTEVVADPVPEAPPAESAEGRVDDRAEVWAALGELSARQRAVLVLRYYEGLPDGEIAALLGGRNGTRTAIRQTQLSCPAKYRGVAPWVPARPVGIGGRSRLAPLRTPASAVVCGYVPDLRYKNLARHLVGHVLTRQRQLTGGLAALAGDLAWLPRVLPGQPIPCLTVLGPQSNYLIGLAYRGGGRSWGSTTAEPTRCVP